MPHYRQAPGTPSKLTITKQQTPSTSLHATSSLLASLDKSILQIRYFHFGKIDLKWINGFMFDNSKFVSHMTSVLNNFRDWLTLLEEMQKSEKVDISDYEHICHMLERQRVSNCNSIHKPCWWYHGKWYKINDSWLFYHTNNVTGAIYVYIALNANILGSFQWVC